LMFMAPATGFAVGVAFIRGLTGRPLGNFYVDLIRSITRITIPIAVIGCLVMVAAGVPETLAGVAIVPTLENPGISQAIARGPVAHFQIIKLLGENGGAFFGAGSAHPFENPNGFTNLWQVLAMLAFPAGLIYTYGIFMGNSKQSWRIYWVIFILVIVLLGITAVGEYAGNPLVNSLLGTQQPNLEGKEVRFGWAQTALFGMATTATMTGASNAAFDSWLPPGQFSALLNIFLQVLFGSVGTGTAQLFVYLLLAIFVIGLMVGRTPEFLGRKIDRAEVTLIGAILLIHPLLILIPSAIALAFPAQLAGISNPGFHGLTQVVFEFASAAAGNGTNMAGLGTNHPAPTAAWYTIATMVTLLAGRYLPAIALLLIADSFSQKLAAPASRAQLSTDTWLFMSVTAATILILGALTFFPILVLGPIAEAFQLNA
jgi:potassium-transporting ATPase potassium-binding subunit